MKTVGAVEYFAKPGYSGFARENSEV